MKYLIFCVIQLLFWQGHQTAYPLTDKEKKTMKVHQILEGFSNPPLELIAETLDQDVTPLKLETLNWEEFSYLPDVEVQIAYNENELFLQYKVNEQSVKAEVGTSNGRVWTDSCVEFFLSPDRNDIYYAQLWTGRSLKKAGSVLLVRSALKACVRTVSSAGNLVVT